MARKALAVLLALLIVLGVPGPGWRAFAQDSYQYDPTTHKLTRTNAVSAMTVPQFLQRLQNPQLSLRIPEAELQQARALAQNHIGASLSADDEAALARVADDLENPDKDPGLALSQFYERFQKAARDEEKRATTATAVDHEKNGQTMLFRDDSGNLFAQQAQTSGYQVSSDVIYRLDEKTHQRVIDTIVEVDQRGVEDKQRIRYSRTFMIQLEAIKKALYDQCALVRKINNGAQPHALEPKDGACQEIDGTRNERLTPAAIQKMIGYYRARQAAFDAIKFIGGDGRQYSLNDYLQSVESRRQNNTLDQLDWRDLQKVQRAVMDFYNSYQLDLMAKYTLGGLQSYFNQVTNSQPKQRKDDTGDLAIDDLGQLEQSYADMQSGKLEGYGWLMEHMGLTKLSEQDKKFITPDLMTAAGDAFSFIQAAVKAQDRADKARKAFEAGDQQKGEEVDAALAESGQWLALARNELQVFQTATLQIQVQRLKAGAMQDNIGLTDQAAKAEADRLGRIAQDYLTEFKKDEHDQKLHALKETLSSFYLTMQDAQKAYLPVDAMAERMRMLAAQARELEALYLQSEFEKVKDTPEFQNIATALSQLNASVYQHFLDQVDGDSRRAGVKNVRDGFAKLAADLDALSQDDDPSQMRDKLDALMQRFSDLAAAFGYGEIPTNKELTDETNAMKVRQARLGQAYQDFAGNASMFYAVNLMDLYVRKSASSEHVVSDNETWWDRAKDTLSTGPGRLYNWMTGGTLEAATRQGIKNAPLKPVGDVLNSKPVNAVMDRLTGGFWSELDLGHSLDSAKAFKLLIENEDERHAILALMSKGDYGTAIDEIRKLDPESARRAAREAEADKGAKDPFESLDLDASLTKAPDDTDSLSRMAAASAVVNSLFSQLKPLIISHMLYSSIGDAVMTSLITGLVGQIASVVIEAVRGTQMFRGVMQTMQGVLMAEDASWLATTAVKVGNLIGKTLLAVFGNYKNASEVSQLGEQAGVVARVKRLGVSVVESAKNTARMMRTMALASGGMSVYDHLRKGDESQFKNAGDAFVQGAIGGLSFGAQAGVFMPASPFQASAWEGAAGRIGMRMAQMGPVDGLVSGAFRIIPGLGESTFGQAVIRSGLWRGLMEISPTARFASGLLSFTASSGMMVDGAAKYYVLGQGSKELGEIGYFSTHNQDSKGLAVVMGSALGAAAGVLAFGSKGWLGAIGGGAAGAALGGGAMAGLNYYFTQKGLVDPGATEYVTSLARSQNFGMDMSQLSWIALPVESMQGSMKDFKEAKEQSYLFERLNDDQLRQVTALPIGDESIMVERSLGHRLASFEFRQIFKGEGARRPFKVDERFKKLAAQKLAQRDGYGTMTLAALASVDPEKFAGWQSLDDIIKAAGAPAGAEEAAARPAALSREGMLVRDALKKAGSAGKPASLYGLLDERGNLQAVSPAKPSGKTKGGIVVEFEVKPDGSFSWADGKAPAEAKLFRKGGFDRAQETLEAAAAQAGEALRAPAAGEAAGPSGKNRVFVSNQAVEAWRQRLAESLAGKDASLSVGAKIWQFFARGRRTSLRDRIVGSEQFVEVKDGKTGETTKVPSFTFTDPASGRDITLTGKTFETVRSEAARQALSLDWKTALLSIPTRFLRELTAQRQQGKSEMIEDSISRGMDKRADKLSGGSPKRIIELARGEITDLISRAGTGAGAEDAAVLTGLRDLLAQKGSPQELIAKAKAKIAEMAGGCDPAALVELRKVLAGGLTPETLEAARQAAGALGPGAARDRLTEILARGNKKDVFKDALKEVDRLSVGAPIDTLASLSKTLDGRLTADDLMYFGRQTMDDRIDGASGVQKKALELLRRPLESNALLQLASRRLIAAEGRAGKDPAGMAQAKSLFTDAWERGVFGQMFKTRVEKDGQKVWEIPAEFRFRDANGNSIPSFRQHQLDAILGNFDSLASGQRMLYDMLATSGGKTLIGFVMLSYLVPYARSHGKEGAYYVTATDDLVVQTQDVYRAMFKGRAPDFEIITYSDLMQKQAMANATGTASPGTTHEMILDEFDQVGLGTPLSLGKFNGALSYAKIDPVQKALSDGVVEAGLPKAGDEAGWSDKASLFGRFGGKQDMAHNEFMDRYVSDRAFREGFDTLVSKTTTRMRRAQSEVDSKSFVDSIPDAYLKEKQMSRRELVAELRREHDNAFGTPTKLGVLEAKYGGMKNYVFKVLSGAYEARAKGPETLGKLYTRDPQREGIIQFHNDAAMDSLDTEYRTALELRENARVTLDFETQSITDFRDICEMLRDTKTTAIALSGTLPDGMRPFLKGVGFKILGRGTDPNKAVGLPHEIVKPVPDLLAAFDKAVGDGAKPAALWADKDGSLLGVGGDKNGGVRLDISRSADGRLALEPGSANEKALAAMEPSGAERVKLLLDSLNAQARPGPDGTPYQLAVARESMLRLLSSRPQRSARERLVLAQGEVEAALKNASADARPALESLRDALSASGEPGEVLDSAWKRVDSVKGVDADLKARLRQTLGRDIAYVWVDSTAKMASLLKDLESEGVGPERVSILTAPGSNFYLQQRYIFKIKAEKNVEGLKAGSVDVVVLAGQGGLRGLEAPLQAYPGGEIKMVVTDSASLAKVSLLQLLGRIDRGRVPESSRTTFTLLDDFNTVSENRYYREAMTSKVLAATAPRADVQLLEKVKASLQERLKQPLEPKEAADLQAALAQVQSKLSGGDMDPAVEAKILTEPTFAGERDDYLNYQAYRRMRDILGDERLKELAALKPAEQRLAAQTLIEDPRLMPTLVAEMRRVVESQQLGSSGITREKPNYFQYQIWRLVSWWRRMKKQLSASPAAPKGPTVTPAPAVP